MPDRQEIVLAALGPFMGLDTFNEPRTLQPGKSPANSNTASNVVGNAYAPVQGRSNVATGAAANAPVTGMFKFIQAGSTAPMYLFTAGPVNPNGGNSGGLSLYSLQSGVITALNFNPAGTIQSPFTPGLPSRWVQYQNWAFSAGQSSAAQIVARPIKVDSSGNVTNWQLEMGNVGTVSGGPIGAVGSGLLNGQYYYRLTYSNAVQESSPSAPLSRTIDPFRGLPLDDFQSLSRFTAQNQVIQITLNSTAKSTDAQVTTINIYRIGGTLGQWQFVASIPNNSVFPYTFTDTTSDSNLTGQNLVLHRDRPAFFTDIEVHKDRIWGFGQTVSYIANNASPSPVTVAPQPANLWFSNYAEPWGWDYVNQVIPIGQNQTGDIAVGLASIGSLLMCFKTKTTWAVYGDDPTMFLPRKLFDVGCISTTSITKNAEGIAFWLSGQNTAYMFDGNQLSDLTTASIKTTIAALPLAVKQAAVGFYYDHVWYLSFPTAATPFTLAYDLTTLQWRTIAFAAQAVAYDPELLDVLAARPNTLAFDSWFTGATDLGIGISASYTSPIYNEPADKIKTYRTLHIIAGPTPASQPITVTLTVNPGDPRFASTTTITHDLQQGSRTYSLPPSMRGREVQMVLASASSVAFSVTGLMLTGWIEHQATAAE